MDQGGRWDYETFYVEKLFFRNNFLNTFDLNDPLSKHVNLSKCTNLLGDIYLSTHTQVGNTPEETEQLLEEHNSFKEKARETREKVKLLLQLADTLVEKGHAHAPNIKQWVEEVDETYKNFSTRMDKYREKVSPSIV